MSDETRRNRRQRRLEQTYGIASSIMTYAGRAVISDRCHRSSDQEVSTEQVHNEVFVLAAANCLNNAILEAIPEGLREESDETLTEEIQRLISFWLDRH